MTLSELIRAQRKKKGMTVAELAEAAGFTRPYFTMLERGQRHMDDETILRVALLLDLDPTTALLAGLRERLPASARKYVPTRLRRRNPKAARDIAREFQAQDFEFEIGCSKLDVSSDWDGNVRIARTLESCRPNPSKEPVFEIHFEERVFGSTGADEPAPSFKILEAPRKLDYELTSTRSGDIVLHRLLFPKGWRRSSQPRDDALSFSLQTDQPQGLFLDHSEYVEKDRERALLGPLRGSLNVHVKHLIKRLEVQLRFPRKYTPQGWDCWTWWGSGSVESVTRNLGDKVCRSLSFSKRAHRAQLVAEQPLAGYTFSIIWTPLDRTSYLRARHGGSRAK